MLLNSKQMVELVHINGSLNCDGNIGSSSSISIGSTSFTSSPSGCMFNSNLLPSTTNTYSIGSPSHVLQSIYVSTGTVFIGPTGSLQIDNNGILQSTNGFSSPFISIGGTNPGNGITLYAYNNRLYFQNQFGQTGGVELFNQASNSVNNYYFTGGNLGVGNSSPNFPLDVKGITQSSQVQTNLITFTGPGKMYFQSGAATGCFIEGLNYNATGDQHNLVYNSVTKELSQSSPSYFYVYSTGTTIFTSINTFTGVAFNVNNVLYHTWQHSSGSSLLTGTFSNDVLVQVQYALQVHSTSNQVETFASVLYLDGNPVPGTYRSTTILGSNGETVLTNNSVMVTLTAGSHVLEIRAAVSNTNVQLGGNPNIPAPTGSYSSASMTCSKVI